MNASIKTASYFISNLADNPRDLLVQIGNDNKGLSKEQVFEKFRSELIKSKEMMRAVQWYFFINMYEYSFGTKNQEGRPRAAENRRASDLQRVEAKILQDTIIEDVKRQLVLLDLMMPNEKLMRDCTGSEMAKFGNRYQQIAAKVGKTKIVGDVLSEDHVREMMK